MRDRFKKILNIAACTAVALAVILAAAAVAARIAGLRPFVVLSGSMAPEYPAGSLILVRSADGAELVAGDVITFMLDERTAVTHRITEVILSEDGDGATLYRTKGDANNAEDMTPVDRRNVIGTPVLSIPYIGYAAEYCRRPPGLYIAIAAAAALLILSFLPRSGRRGGREDRSGG